MISIIGCPDDIQIANEKINLRKQKCLIVAKYTPLSECKNYAAWKVSVFGVILACIFPHPDWIRKDTPYLSVFSLNAGKWDQNNSEYRHFLRSVTLSQNWKIFWISVKVTFLSKKILIFHQLIQSWPLSCRIIILLT